MNKAEKSLRWVVNQIPDFKPTTNEGKMLVAIKLYSEAGAEEISRLEVENAKLKEMLSRVKSGRVSKLKSENAALRERLEKAITPEFKIYEDVHFIDYVNEKGYSDYTTGKPKIREAFITCVSQSMQTEFLYRLQPKDLPQEILNDSTIHDEWWDWRHFYAKEIFKTREAAESRLAELKGWEK